MPQITLLLNPVCFIFLHLWWNCSSNLGQHFCTVNNLRIQQPVIHRWEMWGSAYGNEWMAHQLWIKHWCFVSSHDQDWTRNAWKDNLWQHATPKRWKQNMTFFSCLPECSLSLIFLTLFCILSFWGVCCGEIVYLVCNIQSYVYLPVHIS